jgi:hypothetical protein
MTGSDPTATRAAKPGRMDFILTTAVLGLLLLSGLTVAATGSTGQLLGWAWERHANILSWYIRPLFVLPLAYFAYKRWISGIILTLIALATSMASFPRPGHVQPTVEKFLAFERAWLTSGWTPGKVLMGALSVVGLGALCLAFWKRSLAYGLIVITTLAVGKMAWGVVEGRGAGWAMLAPALAGLVMCNAGILYAMRRLRRRSVRRQPRLPAGAAEDEADHAESAATLSGAGER